MNDYFGLGSIKELPEIKEVIIEDKDDDLFKTKYNDEN